MISQPAMPGPARTTPEAAGERFDVIVIGAGPAGAICAHHLGARGHSVLLVDREDRGRFHIGESLIPHLIELWAQEGIAVDVAAGPFVHKPGVQIDDRQLDRTFVFDFTRPKPNRRNYAYNVERAELDALLTDLAAGTGVRVVQNAEVTDFHMDEDRIVGLSYRCGGRSYPVTARWVVDASGRTGLLARKFGLRKFNTRLKNIALFRHFDGVVEGVNRADDGYQVVSAHDQGWVWGIPIGPRALSVGTVTHASKLKGKDRDTLFEEHLRRVPIIAEAVNGASGRYHEIKVQSDFCYHSDHLAGPGWFMVGDAGCFVDPLFSGGVFLASISGVKAAEAIDRLLSGAAEEVEFTAFENLVKTGYDSYFRLMYVFYEWSNISIARLFDFLPAAPGLPRYWAPYFAQMLSGDFWCNPDAVWLRSHRDLDTFERPFEFVDTETVYADPPVGSGAASVPHALRKDPGRWHGQEASMGSAVAP